MPKRYKYISLGDETTQAASSQLSAFFAETARKHGIEPSDDMEDVEEGWQHEMDYDSDGD